MTLDDRNEVHKVSLESLEEEELQMISVCMLKKRAVSSSKLAMLPIVSLFGSIIGLVEIRGSTDEDCLANALMQAWKIGQTLEMHLLEIHSAQETNYNSNSSYKASQLSSLQFKNSQGPRSCFYDRLISKQLCGNSQKSEY